MTDKKKSMYDEFYAKGKDYLKQITKVVAIRKDKRAFESAYDNAAEKGDNAQMKLHEILEQKIGHYGDHIDDIVKHYRTTKAAQETKDDIKACYLKVFGKELKVEEE